MTEFEILLYCALVISYSGLCYLAGKGDFLNLIPQMLLQKAEEIKKSLEQKEEEDENKTEAD